MTTPGNNTTRRSRDREDQGFVDHMMYILTAPFIGFPGWEDGWDANNNKTTALVHRLGNQQEIFRDSVCSEFEAMVYLSTATMIGPISHDWGQVYMWLFQRWKPDLSKELDVLPDRPELNQNQRDDLTQLRRWIFEQQVRRLKQKGRATDSQPAPAEPEAESEVLEPNLF